ncbi:hypothetical protein GQF02_08205 [Neisseriaceae bacterium B2N2-7]|uniref:Uncharacterized protein n=2 Tax=Craterilacuibacter sinensis TaxID=2686017 RepID=A0A845BWR7_9NEIS|nr:hypothetical protein [Craterilacuibacter sinensis]
MGSMSQQQNNANEVWRKVKALEQVLNAQLPEAIAAAKLGKPGKMLSEVQKTAGERSALALSFPILQRENRKDVEVAWINIQISLSGNGVPHAAVDHAPLGAVMHVAHWACEFSFDYDAYIGFPADGWQPWRNREGRLLSWDESESPFGDEWLYSLQLDAVDSEAGLVECVVAPAIALLQGKALDEALPATLPGLLRYQDIDLADGARDLRIAQA